MPVAVAAADTHPEDAVAPRGRVAHVLLRYVEISETFIPDAILELDRAGWPGTVVATHLVNREHFRYPGESAIRLARRPAQWRRVANRLLLKDLPLRQADWLQPELAAARPDVVHGHFGGPAAAAAPAAQRLGLPLVVSFHGHDLLCHEKSKAYDARGYRRLFRYASCAVVPSEFLAGVLADRGYDGRVEIIPAGIRLERLPFCGPSEPKAGGGLKLVMVGRQVPMKGTDVLIRAMPTIIERCPGVSLDIIGAGEDAEQNEQLARELGVSSTVNFLGAQPHDRTLAAIRAANLVVVPSRPVSDGDDESSSVATREALATGIPVVASRTGGIPDNFPPAYRDELVPPGEPLALAARVCEVLADRESWPMRAIAARRWIEEHFDSRRLAARMGKIYEEVIAQDVRAGRRRLSTCAST